MATIDIKINDWVDFTKEAEISGLSSVLFSKTLYVKLVDWTDDHTQTNQPNTRLERFANNKDLAITQRSYFFTQALKTAITISASEGASGTCQFNYNCETDSGKVDTVVNLSIVRLHGMNENTLLIS